MRELRRHVVLGMRNLCWQKNPDRAAVRREHSIAEMDNPPGWVPDFVVFLAGPVRPGTARAGPPRCSGILTTQPLTDEHPNSPQAVLARAWRSAGSSGRWPAACRTSSPSGASRRRPITPNGWPTGWRRPSSSPQELRPAVRAFAAPLLQNRQRVRTAATRPRTDHHIESPAGRHTGRCTVESPE